MVVVARSLKQEQVLSNMTGIVLYSVVEITEDMEG